MTASAVVLVDPKSLVYIREYPLHSIVQWGYSSSNSTVMFEVDVGAWAGHATDLSLPASGSGRNYSNRTEVIATGFVKRYFRCESPSKAMEVSNLLQEYQTYASKEF